MTSLGITVVGGFVNPELTVLNVGNTGFATRIDEIYTGEYKMSKYNGITLHQIIVKGWYTGDIL